MKGKTAKSAAHQKPAKAKPATRVKSVDVLVIGAVLSGIGAACHLRRQCPTKTFALLARREQVGGTWEPFRYSSIRSG